MNFWYALQLVPTGQLTALCQAAEQAGFDGVLLGEHVTRPGSGGDTDYPYTSTGQLAWDPAAEFPDPVVTVAALGAVTSRLRFATSVLIAPEHSVVALAKAIATAAVLTGSRFDLGVGAGWSRVEYEAVGADFATRGKRLDEMLDVLPRLLRGETVSYRGAHHVLDAVRLSGPLPERAPRIWVGGHSDAALARAARCDGWISTFLTISALGSMAGRLGAERDRLGRSEFPFSVVVGVRGGLTSDTVVQAQAIGVTDLIVPPARRQGGPSAPLEIKLRELQELGEQVIWPVAGRVG